MPGVPLRTWAGDDFGAAGRWVEVGTGYRPINVRDKHAEWMCFGGGGGEPLSLRTKHAGPGGGPGWYQVSSQGANVGTVYGRVTRSADFGATEDPVVGAQVWVSPSYGDYFGGGTGVTHTDANGNFAIHNISPVVFGVPLGLAVIRAVSDPPDYSYTQGPGGEFLAGARVTLTHDHPVQGIDLMLGPGYHMIEYTFGGDTGWWARTDQLLQAVWGPDQASADVDTSVRESSAVSSGLQAEGFSGTGYNLALVGESARYDREKYDLVSWWSLPIGMIVEQTRIDWALNRANSSEDWAARGAQLSRIQVVHNLSGFSVQKAAMYNWAHWEWADTTIGPGLGLGALTCQGGTSSEFSQPYVWQDNVVTLPVIRELAWEHSDDGDMLWLGDLNSLGNVDGRHGLTARDPLRVVQEVDEPSSPAESLQYHLQVSPLADPMTYAEVDAAGYPAYAVLNQVSDQMSVRIYYEY
jgi:hypothetical protein